MSVGGWEAPQTGISRAADNRSMASTWDDAGAHGSLDAVSGGDGHQGIQSRVRQPLFMLLPPTSPPQAQASISQLPWVFGGHPGPSAGRLPVGLETGQ